MSKQGREIVLNFVREKLHEIGAHALIVPTADAHQSEYVSDHDKVRQFVSGFTGSAGTAIVTSASLSPHSQLFTDGRYHEQASKELDSSMWDLQKSGLPGVLTPENWLTQRFSDSGLLPPHVVAYDPLQLSAAQYNTFSSAFEASGIHLTPTPSNFVSDAWNALAASSRPPVSTDALIVQSSEFSGPLSAADKVNALREEMSTANVFALVVSALDEVAWVFNLRGSDISFNPVFMSYGVITQDETILYVDDSADSSRLQRARKALDDVFGSTSFSIKPYGAMEADARRIATLALQRKTEGKSFRIWADPAKTNMMVTNAITSVTSNATEKADDVLYSEPSPVALRKAIKNSVELRGMEQAHIRDGLALSAFLAYLETTFDSLPSRDASADEKNKSILNEHTLACKLEEYRSRQPHFKGLSFDTISSIGGNGSIIHYKPAEKGSAPLTTGKVFLLDSGAQFQDGTTDVTRTFFIARSRPTSVEESVDEQQAETDYHPSAEQKMSFTLVLQGHIALADAVFPDGTVGPALDVFARQFLWRHGMDFAHGTGHGVGSFLNVHEGPLGVGPLSRGGLPLKTALVPGMVLSNEPGYYKTGEYGIRIENLVQVVERTVGPLAKSKFYGMKNLTMVPLDRQLIDITMLSPSEIRWVDEYHQECAQNLLDLLAKQQNNSQIFPSSEDAERTKRWIEKNTRPLRV